MRGLLDVKRSLICLAAYGDLFRHSGKLHNKLGFHFVHDLSAMRFNRDFAASHFRRFSHSFSRNALVTLRVHFYGYYLMSRMNSLNSLRASPYQQMLLPVSQPVVHDISIRELPTNPRTCVLSVRSRPSFRRGKRKDERRSSQN